MLLFPVVVFGNAFWGKTGHRVTGEIAQEHLTGKAKRALEDLLDGPKIFWKVNGGKSLSQKKFGRLIAT